MVRQNSNEALADACEAFLCYQERSEALLLSQWDARFDAAAALVPELYMRLASQYELILRNSAFLRDMLHALEILPPSPPPSPSRSTVAPGMDHPRLSLLRYLSNKATQQPEVSWSRLVSDERVVIRAAIEGASLIPAAADSTSPRHLSPRARAAQANVHGVFMQATLEHPRPFMAMPLLCSPLI